MKNYLYIYVIIALVAISCNGHSNNAGEIGNRQMASVVQLLLDSAEQHFNKYDYLYGATFYADAYNLSKRSNDSSLVKYCANKYIWACYMTGNLAQAENLIKSHGATNYASKSVEIYLAIKQGALSDSQDCFKEAWRMAVSSKDTLDLLLIEAQAYSETNNFKKASESYKEYANRLAQQNNHEVSLIANKAQERYKYIIFVISSIAIFVISILVYRQKKVKRELESILALAKELSNNNHKNNSIVEEKQRLISELFKNQFKYINELANAYYAYSSSPSASSIMYNHVKKTLDKIAKENTSTKHLEKIINTYHNDVISKIREQVPSLNEEHIKLYCYYCAGFSPQMISLLTNDNIDNIYKKKSRLKSKLSNSDAIDKDAFIGLIFSNKQVL